MTLSAFDYRARPVVASGPVNPHAMIGRSRALMAVLRRIEHVSATRSTVLITGETGTGKELVARAVHQQSPRQQRPFVGVNCAAIPASMLESELFGHARGAFTGAVAARKGRFLRAAGGTIFLDEIGSMSVDLQAKLLRVLQERVVEPLGAEQGVPVDVRVIAATNRDLRQLVADGRFQQDLYYRLHVVPITVPPLRERLDDIPLLVDHFVRKHAAHAGRRIDAIDEAVISLLQSHAWPGNVRELENTIERAVVLSAESTLAIDTVTFDTMMPKAHTLPSLRLRSNVEWVERETIRRALEVSGAKRQAASVMGISPRALSYYLAKYRLAEGDDRDR